jgi:hypothetical protein
MTETLLDTVVPEFGFPCMSTEAPLTRAFLRKDSLPDHDRQHSFAFSVANWSTPFRMRTAGATRYSSTVCIFPGPGSC